MQKLLILALLTAAGMAHAQSFTAKLALPWNGVRVPEGQQCRLFGGDGSTPIFVLQGLPEGTVRMRVEYPLFGLNPPSFRRDRFSAKNRL